MTEEWKSKKESFDVLDGRGEAGDFLPIVLKRAEKVAIGEGLCVVQSFEPVPLYSTLVDLGFEYQTDKVSDNEYRVYFYRRESKEASTGKTLHPAALVNYGKADKALGKIAAQFWQLTWKKENPAIDIKTKYLLSLANAVGAGRLRQATRELVKAYSAGVTVAELDELFTLFVWNQGFGTFASAISPSALFAAYLWIKEQEKKGKSRGEVMKELLDKFGEKNPEVGVFYESKM